MFWVSRNGEVQIFFPTSTRNMFTEKFVKRVNFFGCVVGVSFYNVE